MNHTYLSANCFLIFHSFNPVNPIHHNAEERYYHHQTQGRLFAFKLSTKLQELGICCADKPPLYLMPACELHLSTCSTLSKRIALWHRSGNWSCAFWQMNRKETQWQLLAELLKTGWHPSKFENTDSKTVTYKIWNKRTEGSNCIWKNNPLWCMNNVVRSTMLVKELDSRKMGNSLEGKWGRWSY